MVRLMFRLMVRLMIRLMFTKIRTLQYAPTPGTAVAWLSALHFSEYTRHPMLSDVPGQTIASGVWFRICCTTSSLGSKLLLGGGECNDMRDTYASTQVQLTSYLAYLDWCIGHLPCLTLSRCTTMPSISLFSHFISFTPLAADDNGGSISALSVATCLLLSTWLSTCSHIPLGMW